MNDNKASHEFELKTRNFVFHFIFFFRFSQSSICTVFTREKSADFHFQNSIQATREREERELENGTPP